LKLADATALESWLEILPCLIFDEHPALTNLYVCETPVVSCTIKCGPTASNFARRLRKAYQVVRLHRAIVVIQSMQVANELRNRLFGEALLYTSLS
jgi:hypothetical protein